MLPVFYFADKIVDSIRKQAFYFIENLFSYTLYDNNTYIYAVNG